MGLVLAAACGGAETAGGGAPSADASVDVDANARDAAPGLDAATDAAPPDATVEAAAPDAQRWLGPPYPIVFAHGFFGFEDFAGLGFETYFYKLKPHLAKLGETDVITPAVDPFNSSEKRGAELWAHVQALRERTHKEKVIIVGHSQGGLDARVVAHDHPEAVATVVTLSTPHYGSPVADVVLKLVPDSNFQGIVDALVRLVGSLVYDAAGQETSVITALHQLAVAEIAEFNRRYPDAPGVQYWSIAGRSALSRGGADCKPDRAVSFISDWDRQTDTLDVLLSAFGLVLGPDPHDGLVRVKDARWGTFLGCVPADHLDEIGQLLGDKAGIDNPWTYLIFFEELVNFLREQGY